MYLSQMLDLSVLVGSFLAFAGAYWIFRLEQRATARRERAAKELVVENVRDLVQAASDNLRTSRKSYANLARSYRSIPHTIHPRPINVNTPLTTLDRWNRSELLNALQELQGLQKGMETFRSVIAFIDGAARIAEYSETGVLAVMDEATKYAHRFDAYVMDLKLLIPALRMEAVNQGFKGSQLASELERLMRDVHDLGFVNITEIHERLLGPFSRLFRMNLIDLRETNRLTETLNGANGMYARYGQKCVELAELAERAEQDLGAVIKVGEDVISSLGV